MKHQSPMASSEQCQALNVIQIPLNATNRVTAKGIPTEITNVGLRPWPLGSVFEGIDFPIWLLGNALSLAVLNLNFLGASPAVPLLSSTSFVGESSIFFLFTSDFERWDSASCSSKLQIFSLASLTCKEHYCSLRTSNICIENARVGFIDNPYLMNS